MCVCEDEIFFIIQQNKNKEHIIHFYLDVSFDLGLDVSIVLNIMNFLFYYGINHEWRDM